MKEGKRGCIWRCRGHQQDSLMGWQGAAGDEDRAQCVLRRKGVLEQACSSVGGALACFESDP